MKKRTNTNTNTTATVINPNIPECYDMLLDRYPTLSAEREHELVDLAHKGDAHAREMLILSNLRLAVRIANKWVSDRLPLSDLIGPAIEGLITGIDNYNPERSARVYNYLVWTIVERVQAYHEAMSNCLATPHRAAETLADIRQARQRLEQEMGCRIDEQELLDIVADELGTDASRLQQKLNAERCKSFEEPVIGRSGDDDDEALTFGDTIADDNDVETLYINHELLDLLSQGMDRLPKDLREVLTMFYGFDGNPRTLKDIAAELHLSVETIRKRRDNGHKMLRGWLQPAYAA